MLQDVNISYFSTENFIVIFDAYRTVHKYQSCITVLLYGTLSYIFMQWRLRYMEPLLYGNDRLKKLDLAHLVPSAFFLLHSEQLNVLCTVGRYVIELRDIRTSDPLSITYVKNIFLF